MAMHVKDLPWHLFLNINSFINSPQKGPDFVRGPWPQLPSWVIKVAVWYQLNITLSSGCI